jgi:peptide subunit release factor 1 (eRF1)
MEAQFRTSRCPSFRRFQLQHFEAAPSEVLKACNPVIDALRKERYEVLAREWTERPGQAIFGLSQTLLALEQGRVRTVLLDRPIGGDAAECGLCGRWQEQIADRCLYCHSKALHLVPIEGLLVRKALLAHGEIVSSPGSCDIGGEVRAILRY